MQPNAQKEKVLLCVPQQIYCRGNARLLRARNNDDNPSGKKFFLVSLASPESKQKNAVHRFKLHDMCETEDEGRLLCRYYHDLDPDFDVLLGIAGKKTMRMSGWKKSNSMGPKKTNAVTVVEFDDGDVESGDTKIATELTLIWAYCDAVIAANPTASASATTATLGTSTYAPVSTATVRPVTSVYSGAAETTIVGAAAAVVALYLL
ncbi:UNVERIFIED_CONTAM: hypothetical protein HDU68_012762 [Siphonaria sp. JEL0065]|nr:hypothetical protein HDU68_012762 [Siphonaria sp. JEL0065]